MLITSYTHFFTVTGHDGWQYKAIKEFAFRLADYDYRGVYKARAFGQKPPAPTLKKIYAAFTDNKREWRFHIHSLAEFKTLMDSRGLTYDEENAELYKFTPVDLKLMPGFVARENQIPLIDYMVDKGVTKILNLQTGQGKASINSELVLTPTGWKRMGDMQVGDKVICPDGTVSNVIGVYPQGETDVYNVSFYDGRTIKCCPQHLWKVYYVNTVPHRRWRVVDTLEVKRLISMPNPRVYVPLIEQPFVGFHNGDLPLDPYLVGVLLGDGAITTGSISICKLDIEVIERCRKPLEDLGYYLQRDDSRNAYAIRANRDTLPRGNNPLLNILKELGMHGCRAWEKVIPEVYMNAPYEARLALIQGLMDTDGYVGKSGEMSFTTTSQIMADQFRHLSHGFGDICTMVPKTKNYTYKGETKAGRMSWNLLVRSQKPSQYFSLTRKKERVCDDNQYAKDLKMAVRSVDFVGRDQTTCIAIDHPEHLYITTNFVVTHNTFCALSAACRIGGKILVSIEARFFNLWSEAFDGKKKVVDIDPSKEVVYIQGSKDLKKAMQMVEAGLLDDVKVFICSSRTLINFIEAYEKFNGELDGVYPCSPHELYELFDIGSRIKDEVHLSLWANFKEELYLHVGKSFSLSATLEDGTFLDRVLAVMFPKEIRSPEVEYLKYIDVYSLMYALEKPDQVKTSHRGSTDYSHNAYEDYILKNRKMFASYSQIMVDWLREEYLSIRKDKQRACIFVSSVEMATAIWKVLEKAYPNVSFARYAASAGDIYDEAKQANVLITTVQSFGTGFDLEDLIASLMTTNLRSQKTNLQVLGRLRVLKNYPGQTPKFYYLICSDIRKHMAYHEEKKLQFNGKVKSHQNRFLRITV